MRENPDIGLGHHTGSSTLVLVLDKQQVEDHWPFQVQLHRELFLIYFQSFAELKSSPAQSHPCCCCVRTQTPGLEILRLVGPRFRQAAAWGVGQDGWQGVLPASWHCFIHFLRNPDLRGIIHPKMTMTTIILDTVSIYFPNFQAIHHYKSKTDVDKDFT